MKNGGRKWCPGTESNRRHGDFQSPALPTELPGHDRERGRRGAITVSRRLCPASCPCFRGRRPDRLSDSPRPAISRGRDHGNPGYKRRSEEHTSELQSLMRISYAVFCLKKKKKKKTTQNRQTI